MSIPPLVCSTPPPLEQCEEDKDPEDYDLSYSFSQDDDDENNDYNYGNFSSYTNFLSKSDNKPLELKEPEVTINIENKPPREVFLTYDSKLDSEASIVVHSVLEANDINENKLKCDEDMNVEDLNLKVDEEVENITATNSVQIEARDQNIVVKDFDIPLSSSNDSPISVNIDVPTYVDSPVDEPNTLQELNEDFVAPITNSINVVTKVEVNNSDTEEILQESIVGFGNNSEEPEKLESAVIQSENNSQNDHPSNHYETISKEQGIDEDFGDFDDFKFENAKSNVTSIADKSDNPWQNNNSTEFEFGNFTANFENKHCEDDINLKNESISNNIDHLNSEIKEIHNQLDNDDFGDFDDFQSSSTKTEVNELPIEASPCNNLPVLNLQSSENEHQVLESINNVLSSVFLEEILEPESEFEDKLESLLSETWGYLMETDERQPYIVNWNNSLGQKTLLKALCIDSRNILFGPKWSSNMPKYAANLSNAPLQPQKQASVTSSVLTQNETLAEKCLSKPTTWNDPFTSDGQESCNSENENTTVTPGPTDLDVFEAESTKSEKIYSNTIGVQPLRQINLPDTHIFTPTDSEIPRSKTIHNDRTSTVLLPQTTSETINPINTTVSPNTNSTQNSNINDDEYWEFQNYKSNSDTSTVLNSVSSSLQITSQEFETATTVNALPKLNIAYQTELLQPIRVEPAVPTLNWPDPGEVKGAFDDFSDFVSISSKPIERQESISTLEFRSENVNINPLDNFTDQNEKTNVASEIANSNNLDDDFDTFQSAQASEISNHTFKSSFSDIPTTQIPSSRITEIGSTHTKLDSIKSDTISFGSMYKSNEALTQNVGFISNKIEKTSKSLLPSGTPMQTTLLQPTPASSSAVNLQSQQKSTQILQPLSLESYSQINWPSPGIDLQDLSRFNPVESVHSLKSDLSASNVNKSSPVHAAKITTASQGPDDDVWGEFVSSKPKQQSQPKKPSVLVDDDEWTDFISSPSIKPVNGLNTISLNVHTNSNIQKSVQNKYAKKSNQPPLDIPSLNYITPKSNPHMSYNDKHFQNL